MLAAFQKLTTSAAELNSVSDELGKPIAAIEAALKRLNLGVAAWVPFDSHIDHDTGGFLNRSGGYAKVAGKWGIAIRSGSGVIQYNPEGAYEEWLFGDAPRALRLNAVGHLPELLEKLVVEAAETTEKLRNKIGDVQQVAKAVTQAAAAGNTAPRK